MKIAETVKLERDSMEEGVVLFCCMEKIDEDSPYNPHSADVRRDFTIFPAIVFLNITLLIQAYVFRDISHFLDHLPSLRAFILYF